jgi:hypothetical protein
LAQDAPPLVDDAAEHRMVTIPRCAYDGRWGSFHLTGLTGTAGYTFRGAKWVANLEYVRDDANFFYYRQIAGGDTSILLWGFAKRNDADGRYAVWRRTPDGWRVYECTDWWGQLETMALTVAASDEGRFDAIDEALRIHEERIRKLEKEKAKEHSQP